MFAPPCMTPPFSTPLSLTPLSSTPLGSKPVGSTPPSFRPWWVVLLVLCLLPTTAGADAAGVISQASGQVLLVESVRGAGGPAFPARPLQVLATGTFLELGRGGAAAVLCSGDRLVRLSGPTSWRVGPQTCARGTPVPAGTFAGLVPGEGRRIQFAQSLLEESPSRGDDGFGSVPILLSPRSPQRLEVAAYASTPDLVWVEVRGSLEYELILGRNGREHVVQVKGQKADCQPDLRTRPQRGCRIAWPWPALTAGETVTLTARARVRDADRPVRETDPSRLHLVSGASRRQVAAELAVLGGDQGGGDGASDPSLALLKASLFERHGLFNEAAEQLVALLEHQPQATVALQLADLYLGLGVHQSALHLYSRAESMLPTRGEEALRAAVQLGFGRCHLRGKDPDARQAVAKLEYAAKLFRRAQMDESAAEAQAEADLARRSLP